MATTSPLYDQIKETALYYIHSYDEDVIRADVSNLSRALAPDCRRYYAPASMVEMLPQLSNGETNDEYVAKERPFFENMYESWTIEAKDITVDEAQRKAVIYSLHDVKAYSGSRYPFEFCFILWMDDKAERVVKILEFVDITIANKFFDENPDARKHLSMTK